MNNIILIITISLFLISCETDVNQPVHEVTYIDSFSCNWIVILDIWGEPVEHKCWSVKSIYLEEFEISPRLATKIIVSIDENFSEALVENPEGLEITYDISDTTKVVYEKTYRRSYLK
ncbi:MAG: hypothetical protein GQ534_02040 [Candidatus Delongbacteria bacterium]|nr:hypothetical protein [Candidatus Delongbacteria bacterium]